MTIQEGKGEKQKRIVPKNAHFPMKIFSRLRRGDFRYTTILFKAISSYFSQTSLDEGFQKNLGAGA